VITQQKLLKNNSKLKKEHFQLKETIATIVAENDFYIEIAKEEIENRRNDIEQFIKENKDFVGALKPLNYIKNAPEIINKMCESSVKLNVGPMATVAGIIAEYAVKAMIADGAKHAIVDNGGDIAIFSDRAINVGIYTGNIYTDGFALKIEPKNQIYGVCTSSGKIGHSLSFGNCDAVTVLSHNLSVADAAATALGNLVQTRRDIKNAFNILEDVDEIIGAVIFVGDHVGIWGKIPRIIRADVPYELITRGW